MSTTLTSRVPAISATTPEYADRWTRAGLWALPAYGMLTLVSAVDPQPDPGQDYAAWARFVTTPRYLLGHLLGTGLGLVLAVLGLFALGVFLVRGRSGRLGLAGMLLSVLGNLLFLSILASSAFGAPTLARLYLAGVTDVQQLQADPAADLAQTVIFLAVIVLNQVGSILLGIAIWRSGVLPRPAGVLWVGSGLLLYGLDLVIGLAFTHNSVLTEPIGAAVVAVSGVWMAVSARRIR